MNNIISKIRKNGFVLLAAALGGVSTGCLTSCGDFLEIKPQNEITLEKFWNEKGDVEGIINGCYSSLQSYATISRMMIWGEFRSENVVWNGTGNEDVNLERLLKENITASNIYTTWGEFYAIINRCNTVIKYAPQVAEVDPSYTQSQLKAHIAEVTALRSLCYFYLIRTFRDVPYSEEAFLDDSQKLDLPATPFNEVLDKLIASLENVKNDALEVYPKDASEFSKYYNTGRITKWAIYSMLCEMYLWKKDYNKCIEYANLIIDYKKQKAKGSESNILSAEMNDFNGYPLYGTRYRSMNNQYGRSFNSIFVTGNSDESIFELTFDKKAGDKQLSNGPFNNFYGGQGRKPWVLFSSYVSHDEIDKLYNVFDKANAGLDARAYENMSYAAKAPDYINKCTAKQDVTLGALPTANDFFSKCSWGLQYDTYGTNHDSRNKANFIFYRLTDIMLLQAEAYTQLIAENSGTLTDETDIAYRDKAFQLVNAVNKRSLMQQNLKDTLKLETYGTKTMIEDLVYQERHRELMFEGKWYFDLVRRSQRDGNTDFLRQNCQNKSADLKSVISSKMQKMDAIYWPYNLDEIKANKNLIQNSAFGSGENSSFENSAK